MIHARTTDPTSSHSTVEAMVDDRLSITDLGEIIRQSFGDHEWFTDDDIAKAVARRRPNMVRNNMARRRLELERQDPPVVVRVAPDSIPDGMRQRLIFRLARPGDRPFRTLAEQRPEQWCPHCAHCQQALTPPTPVLAFGEQLEMFG